MTMTRLLLTLALLLWATTAQAQGSIVQSANNADAHPFGGDATGVTTFGATTTSGNVSCAVFAAGASSRTVTSVTDDGGNTYSLVPGATAEVASTSEAWIYCSKTTATAQIVTVTLSSACTCEGEITIYEIGNTTASPIEDGSGAAVAANTTHDTGTVTTAGYAVLIGGSFRTGTSSWTIDADFTQSLNVSGAVIGYDLVSAGGNYSMTNTTSGNTDTSNVLAAITANAPGGGSGCPGMLLRGVCE